MAQWKIENEEKAKPEDLRYLVGQLKEFNDAHSPVAFERREVRLFVRDENGQIMGGLLGSVNMHCLVIQIMWVDASQRGLGIGRALVAAAEDMARAAGALQAIVETTDFQAPIFYEKLGYQVIFVVDDAPIGAKTIFMRRKL